MELMTPPPQLPSRSATTCPVARRARGFPPGGVRKLAVALMVVLAVLVAPAAGRAAAQAPQAPGAPAPAAAGAPPVAAAAGILVDDATGAVLWQRNGHQPRSVASTTKILTALVAEDVFDTDQMLTVPKAAETVEGSRLGVQAGMRFSRNDLLAALLLVSGNDVAETLAANHPGGRAGFLHAMQATCELLGCTDSTWRDPSGLDAPGHQASAADLAVVSRALLARPYLASLVAAPTYQVTWPDGHKQVLDNHNKMVRYDTDPGTIGVKTGYTDKAGHTLVSAQRRGDRTLIAVVLDAEDHYEQVRNLFGYGFNIRPPKNAEVLGLTAEDIERQLQPESKSAPDAATRPRAGGGGGFSPLVAAAVAAVLLLAAGVVLTVVVGHRSRRA